MASIKDIRGVSLTPKSDLNTEKSDLVFQASINEVNCQQGAVCSLHGTMQNMSDLTAVRRIYLFRRNMEKYDPMGVLAAQAGIGLQANYKRASEELPL